MAIQKKEFCAFIIFFDAKYKYTQTQYTFIASYILLIQKEVDK